MEQDSQCWIGIDWGGDAHAVHVFQPATDAGERFTVPHSAQGLEALVQRLSALGAIGGIAVEAARNLLLVKGAVPGASNGLLLIRKSGGRK